jgi:hypothetical protein
MVLPLHPWLDLIGVRPFLRLNSFGIVRYEETAQHDERHCQSAVPFAVPLKVRGASLEPASRAANLISNAERRWIAAD